MAETMLVNSMVILTLLFWGAWGIFDKKALGHTAPLGQLVAVYCFSPILAVIVAGILSIWVPGWHLTEHTLFYALLGSISYFVATIAYLIAMTKGEASLILGVTASYPLIAQALAFIMLGEELNMVRIIGCVVMIAGIIVLTGSGNCKEAAPVTETTTTVNSDGPMVTAPTGAEQRAVPTVANHSVQLLDERKSTQQKAQAGTSTRPSHLSLACIICVLVAVTGWAVRGMFDKIALEHPAHPHPFEVYLGKFICDSALGIVALVWLLVKRPEINVFSRSLRPWAAGSAICLAGGSGAYYIALSKLSASYVIAITGCYPLFMYLLAVWCLKEKFNMTRAIGIVLITLGGIITQLTQG